MAYCIFCDSELNSDTKPEHILLNALGGRKSTRGVVCTRHNEIFGSTIDKALTDQIPILRNLLHLESGTGKSAPMLRDITAGADKLNIKADGTLELVAKPLTLIERPDGTKELKIQARSAEHLAQLVPHIAAQLKITEERTLELLKTSQAAIISRRPGVIGHQLEFGGPDAMRSMTKSCLELWATLVGNDEVKSAPCAAARRFVLTGDPDFLSGRTCLDARLLPHLDEMTAGFGDIFNLIYVRSDTAGRVIGHFTLYNIVAWQVVLAEQGGRPDTRIGLISNASQPAVWSDRIADDIDIEFAWLNAPDDAESFARVRTRIGAMIERHQQRLCMRRSWTL